MQGKKPNNHLTLKKCNNSLSQNGQFKSFFILFLKVFEDLKNSIPQLSHLNIIRSCMRILFPRLTIVNYIYIKNFSIF